MIGREDDIDRLFSLVESAGVLLSGARRIGKTEMLKALALRSDERWQVVFLDLQGLDNLADVLGRLEEALNDVGLGPGVLARAAGAVEGATVAGVKIGGHEDDATGWTRFEQLIRGALDRVPDGKRLLLLCDEIPWLLEGLRAAR